MKKLILSTVVIGGMVVTALSQGTVAFDNTENADMSPTALSGGLLWVDDGTGPVLNNADINMQLLGGADAGSMSTIVTLLLSDSSALGMNFGTGIWADPSGSSYAVPGVALNGTATLEILAWTGSFDTYAAAVAGGAMFADSGTFTNPTGGGGTPAVLPQTMKNMPAMVLTAVPEPGTLALVGLGIAGLLAVRRRK